MPSSWETYYVFFLSGGLALCIPIVLLFLSRALIREKSRGGWAAQGLPETIQSAPGSPLASKRINTRFFLAANSTLVLIGLLLVLIPCVAAGSAVSITLTVVLIALIGAVGSFYAAKKGDLSWNTSTKDK